MTYAPVLGPYQFTNGTSDTCGCFGQTYCTPFENLDTIAFQVVSECCGETAGCETLTEECVEEQEIEFHESFEGLEDGCNTFPPLAFFTPTRIVFMPFAFEAGKQYKICFCLEQTNANEPINLTPYVQDDVIRVDLGSAISGTGTFCYTFVADSAWNEFGLYVENIEQIVGGFKICCMTVCELTTYTADLIDEDGQVVTSIPATAIEGGQAFELDLLIPGEIPFGCYQIKLTNSCDEEEYLSQCLKFQPASCDTLLLQYRNRNNAFGFDYITDPTYYNSLRVKGRLKHPTFPDESNIVLQSNNSNVTINSRVQRMYVLALDDLPDYIHSAMAVARRHSEFLIEGTPYVTAEGDYTPNWRKSSELATVTFEVFDQNYDGVATFCSN